MIVKKQKAGMCEKYVRILEDTDSLYDQDAMLTVIARKIKKHLKIKNLKRGIFVMLLFVLMVNIFIVKSEAYVLTGYVLSNPSNVKYKISSGVGQYSSLVATYAKKWSTHCDEITMVGTTTNENIYFYGELNVDNGTFATTFYNRKDYSSIVFYKSFVNASVLERQEVVVHEVGHALGLDHCQSSLVKHSVMRATGFNGKAYPLSDDIKGISAIY